MIMGVVIGTYSSIFIASPTVLLWGRKEDVCKEIIMSLELRVMS